MNATVKRTREGKWAMRTVCEGRVVIGGVTFRPSEEHLAYDGRLDGHRFAFGKYAAPGGGREPYVSLWGTVEAYQNPEQEIHGPELVDGAFPWMFWRATP